MGPSVCANSNPPLNPAVCVDKTVVGTMAHSTPIAEITGKLTVIEHLPKHDMSCIVAILFILLTSLRKYILFLIFKFVGEIEKLV